MGLTGKQQLTLYILRLCGVLDTGEVRISYRMVRRLGVITFRQIFGFLFGFFFWFVLMYGICFLFDRVTG